MVKQLVYICDHCEESFVPDGRNEPSLTVQHPLQQGLIRDSIEVDFCADCFTHFKYAANNFWGEWSGEKEVDNTFGMT